MYKRQIPLVYKGLGSLSRGLLCLLVERFTKAIKADNNIKAMTLASAILTGQASVFFFGHFFLSQRLAYRLQAAKNLPVSKREFV